MSESTKPVLTEDRARKLIQQAVAERGADYVYRGVRVDGHVACKYLTYDAEDRPTGPACIVGHVLVAAGVPLHALAASEGISANGVVPNLVEAPGPVVVALDSAQGVQDSRRTWGEAFEEFGRILDGRRDPS